MMIDGNPACESRYTGGVCTCFSEKQSRALADEALERSEGRAVIAVLPGGTCPHSMLSSFRVAAVDDEGPHQFAGVRVTPNQEAL